MSRPNKSVPAGMRYKDYGPAVPEEGDSQAETTLPFEEFTTSTSTVTVTDVEATMFDDINEVVTRVNKVGDRVHEVGELLQNLQQGQAPAGGTIAACVAVEARQKEMDFDYSNLLKDESYLSGMYTQVEESVAKAFALDTLGKVQDTIVTLGRYMQECVTVQEALNRIRRAQAQVVLVAAVPVAVVGVPPVQQPLPAPRLPAAAGAGGAAPHAVQPYAGAADAFAGCSVCRRLPGPGLPYIRIQLPQREPSPEVRPPLLRVAVARGGPRAGRLCVEIRSSGGRYSEYLIWRIALRASQAKKFRVHHLEHNGRELTGATLEDEQLQAGDEITAVFAQLNQPAMVDTCSYCAEEFCGFVLMDMCSRGCGCRFRHPR